MKVAARPERRLETATLAARITPVGELAQDELVVVGVSTGGPRTLEEVLPQLPADFPVRY